MENELWGVVVWPQKGGRPGYWSCCNLTKPEAEYEVRKLEASENPPFRVEVKKQDRLFLYVHGIEGSGG